MHSERKHALLSASGSSRWMNCTPSARLEEKFQETSSVFAQEGTLAHEYSDVNLRHIKGEISDKILNSEIRKIKKNDLYNDEIPVETHKYMDIVLETYQEAKLITPDAKLLIEERLDFSHLVEQGFGTGDVCIIADGILYVIDLKYGKGIRVDSDNNPQLMLYGSGALRKFEMLYDIHTVRLMIVQPRLDHVSSWDISTDDLIEWGETEVLPKAKKANLGEGEKKVGDWCRFCKVKPTCRAFSDKQLEIAKHEFKEPDVLSDKELIEIYEQMPMVLDWINSVSSYLLNEAVSKNKKWPNHKLVEGRSNRKWSDEEKVKLRILAEKDEIDEDDLLSKKLLGITAIQKLLGKQDFDSILSDLVIKPPGKPTLVHKDDKRPELNSLAQAKEDFKD